VSRRACVIGHPVAHSRSPLIHGYWLREHKIDGEYMREDVRPENIDRFLDRLAERYVGANVTIPHKEAAFAKLQHPDAIAQALGAANTLWFENGALSGIIESGNLLYIVQLLERDEQRPIADQQKPIVGGREMFDWLSGLNTKLDITRDLTDDDRARALDEII